MRSRVRLPKFLRAYSGLPREIYILFFIRIINAMGSFVFPILTLFLTDKLGLSASKAGLFVSLSGLSYIPGGILGGKLADIIGRKKVMVIFQAIAAVLFIPCAFLGNSMIIPWLLILAGVSLGAVQPANSAMVADITTSENRKEAFSLIYLGINIGFSVGPLIAGFLYRNYLPLSFIGNAVVILISVFVIAAFMSETKPDSLNKEEASDEDSLEGESIFSVLLKKPVVLAYALLSSVYSFAYSTGIFGTNLQFRELFGNMASSLVGGISATNGIVVVTMTTAIVFITRRNKPLFNIALSGAFFATGFGMMFFIKLYPLFIFSTIVWTIGEIINATNSGVYIADHAPSSHRGRFNSVLSIITGAGSAIGPIAMGRYSDAFGVRNIWPFVFCVTMLAAFFIYVLHLKEQRKHEPA